MNGVYSTGGLTFSGKCVPSRLKRFFRSDINYKNSDEFIQQARGKILGNLPQEIINLFPSNKGENIKQFLDILGQTAVLMRAEHNKLKYHNVICYDLNELDKQDLRKIEKNISDFFNIRAQKILPDGVSVAFAYAGRGVWANAFRFSLQDKSGNKLMHDKSLKVFFNHKCPIDTLKDTHNLYAEANFWEFIKHAAGHKLDKTQLTRHYISDLKGGYIMTEFCDEKISKTTVPLLLEKIFKLKTFDNINNNYPLFGKLYDAGGYRKIKGFINDKVTLRYYKQLQNRNSTAELKNLIAKLEGLVENPKTPHRDKIKAALNLFLAEHCL